MHSPDDIRVPWPVRYEYSTSTISFPLQQRIKIWEVELEFQTCSAIFFGPVNLRQVLVPSTKPTLHQDIGIQLDIYTFEARGEQPEMS